MMKRSLSIVMGLVLLMGLVLVVAGRETAVGAEVWITTRKLNVLLYGSGGSFYGRNRLSIML
ncbi:MAG: hypothetical protein M5U34_00640 [Chloroflexi bacterium]|nr:hypothetical protein [Chloroflexota bacterium]